MTSYAIIETPRTHVGLPEAPLSKGELLTVPPPASPVPAAAYARAVDLVRATDARVTALESLTGPKALAPAFDRWAKSSFSAFLTSVGGGVATIFGLAGALAMGTDGAYLESGLSLLAGVAGAGVAFTILSAETRADRAVAQRRTQRIESKQLESVLRAYDDAPVDVRAIAKDAVAARLANADESLSAEAALKGAACVGALSATDPQKRAACLTAYITRLLDSEAHPSEPASVLKGIGELLGEAPPDERREMAAALEQLVFSGEQARFKSSSADQRWLWASIKRAKAGEAPLAAESTQDA